MEYFIYVVLPQLVLLYCFWQVIQYYSDNVTMAEWRLHQAIWEKKASIRWYEEQIRALEDFKDEINRQLLGHAWREDWWHDDITKPPTLH